MRLSHYSKTMNFKSFHLPFRAASWPVYQTGLVHPYKTAGENPAKSKDYK